MDDHSAHAQVYEQILKEIAAALDSQMIGSSDLSPREATEARLTEMYAAHGVEVVGFDWSDDLKSVRPIVALTHVNFTLRLDDD